MSIVTIIGAGMMGSAMSFPLHDNGHEVRLVGTHLDRDIIASVKRNHYHPTLERTLPSQVKPFQIEDLIATLVGSDLIIGGISSFGIDWFAKQILPQLPDNTPVLLVTKGLKTSQEGGLITFPDHLSSLVESKRNIVFNAIGGPCTSYELADRNQSQVTFCGPNLDLLLKLKKILTTDYYRISLSQDITGIETAVALKNAYALAVTLAIGLEEQVNGVGCRETYNPQAALFGQSVREMTALVKLLGGKDESVIAGIADLYVTIFGGRTRMLGTLLGRGLTFQAAISELAGVTLESVAITQTIVAAIRDLAKNGQVQLEDYPLLIHIDELINHDQTVNIPWQQFETLN